MSTGTSKPYSAFPKGMRWFIVSLIGIAGIFSPISSNIFVPAIPVIAQAFHRSEQDITLAVTAYLIFQAITPSFLGSLSDSYGRRPVAIVMLVVYIGANIGLAMVPTGGNGYAVLLVLRMLQATGGSCLIAIGAGCVNDVAEPREKGMFMGIFQTGSMSGPAFGPLLGGVLAQTLGWRSIFWFLVIATGVVLTGIVFFLPETLRSLVGDGSIPPPKLNSSPQQLWQHHKATVERKRTGVEKVHVNRPAKRKYEPFSAFKVLLQPETVLIFVFSSIVYLEMYSILAVYSTILKDKYGLDEIKIGLCYLPCGIGTIVSAITNGRLIDWMYRREERRVGGDFRKCRTTFRLEPTRFKVCIGFLILFWTGAVCLGWCLEARTSLAAVLVFNLLVGLGSGPITALPTVYGQDLQPGKGGAVSASLNLVRCMFGAVGTAVIQLLYSAIGAGWTMTLMTGMCLVALPMPVVVWRQGAKWRARRDEKAEMMRQAKSEREQQL